MATRYATYRWMWAVIGLAVLAPMIACAQSNGSSFTETATLQKLLGTERMRPTTRCEDLRSAGEMAFTVVTAQSAEKDALCRLHGVIPLEVEFMLEMPRDWNGRLYVLGNGGFAGESVTSDYGAAERARAAALGFATLFTNLGHDQIREPGAEWARGNYAKKIDYGVRALHVSTLAAKDLLARYYGRPAQRSYFDGCSTGGGQALKAAQRFPADYDGILGGAPVFDFVRLQLYGWNNQMAILETPLSREKVALLGRRIMELFDARDGVKDNVIENPMGIDFDPARDLPHAGPNREGFTDAEIKALTRIYRGTYLDGEQLAPGIAIGAEPAGQVYSKRGNFDPAPAESGWSTRLVPDRQGNMQQRGNVEGWLKYMAFPTDEPEMDILKLDLRRDVPRMRAMSQIMDATDPNLSAFEARGGKFLLYHGWADAGVNPLMTIQYYEQVRATMSKDPGSFMRLFMIPGMFHCRGGLGADRFDAATALVAWVEENRPPQQLTATRMEDGKATRTRLLCPYPKVAHYSGARTTDDARNYSCESPKPRS